MLDIGLCCCRRLHDYILNLSHQFALISSAALKDVHDGFERALVAAFLISARLFPGLVRGAVFVDRVVGQVHEEVLHIPRGRLLVGLRREASQSFLVDVDSQRVDTVDKHVDPQVVLQVVHQVRRVQVVLDHPAPDPFLLMRLLDATHDRFHAAAEEYSLALRQAVWLHNESLAFLLCVPVCWLVKLIAEVDIVAREHPSLREEVELFLKCTLHAHQVPRQVVFSRDRIHARVVVDFLVRVQLREEVGCDAQIMPAHVPLFDELLVVLALADGSIVVLRVLSKLVTEDFPGDLLDNVILSAVYVHEKRSLLTLIFFIFFAVGVFDLFSFFLQTLAFCLLVFLLHWRCDYLLFAVFLARARTGELVVVILLVIVVVTARGAIRLG